MKGESKVDFMSPILIEAKPKESTGDHIWSVDTHYKLG
jgi:hypothetical protein